MSTFLPLGQARDSEEFRTSSHRLAAYAAAVLDPNPQAVNGSLANPIFAHVPVMQSLVEVITAKGPLFAFHGEHDMLFQRPIEPGMRLFSRSALIGTRVTRAGLVLIVKSDTENETGAQVATQWSTLMLTGRTGATAGDAVPDRPDKVSGNKGRSLRETIPIAQDLTLHYADAARDYSPYTLDREAAAAQGLKAPIVHGICTLAIAAGRIVNSYAGGAPERLRRIGCRFTRPLFLVPGQLLSLTLTAFDNGVITFSAIDSDGITIMSRGYAEISQ